MSSKPRDPRWDPRPGDVLLDANQLTRKVVRTERIGIRWVGCFDLRDAIDAAMESGAGAQKGRK